MNCTQAPTLELFQTLSALEKRELVERLADRFLRGDFHDHMTVAQKAELAAAIGEANRGQMTFSGDLRAHTTSRNNLRHSMSAD
jgi:hypothetical protein